MTRPIVIVQGGQWGSEAKGMVAGYLCKKDRIDIAVRTGATNAGHTVYHNGTKVVMQQLPTGWVNPDTTLVVGAGALIDPEILKREVEEVSRVTGTDIRQRLKIDRRAGLHVPAHAARSKASGRHHAIGATGKGCSEALIDRIKNRGTEGNFLFGDSPYTKDYDVCDTEAYLNWSWNEGAGILLEGTQGQLLDLYLGPYPYVTHKQTGPAQWMLECGLSPSLPTETCMVVRTFPIRVAGNSGPMPQEISWPILARQINEARAKMDLPAIVKEESIDAFEEALEGVSANHDIPLGYRAGLSQYMWTPQERVYYQRALSELNRDALQFLPDAVLADLSNLFELTTVTKKLRRIARIDGPTLIVSARQIRPKYVALTFMNYQFPGYWKQRPDGSVMAGSDGLSDYMYLMHSWCGAPVRLASFGPEDAQMLDFQESVR
jgi:adenylosuccinate synthase